MIGNKGITPLIILAVLMVAGFAILVFATTFPALFDFIEAVIPDVDPLTAIFLAAIPVILLVLIGFAIKAIITGEKQA